MKNKTMRVLISLFAVLLMVTGFSVTAYAGGGEGSESEPPPASEPEPTPPPNPVALTPDGNLTLVDDIDGVEAEEQYKQFITVVTKDGNYFYIIIDRVGDKENVYFLNMVDEADLLALIEDMDTVPAPVVTPEPEQPPTSEPDPEPEPEQKGGASGLVIFLVLALAAGGGTFYYFKVLKPKQAVQGGTELDELDELDFEGDGFMGMDADEPEQEDGEE